MSGHRWPLKALCLRPSVAKSFSECVFVCACMCAGMKVDYGEDKCVSLGVNACIAFVSLFSLQPNLCTAMASSVSGSGWMSLQPTVS